MQNMWIQNVDCLDVIFKGVLVGIVASAPMGPVGVLVVQRTLNKGRWYGFVTGLGATVSDLLYAVITGLGLSFVMDFVSNPQSMRWLQIVSSILLFTFGLLAYRSHPEQCLRPKSKRVGTLWQNAVTGFALTISNPLIILLFLVLFTRFRFVLPNVSLHLLGYASIAAGSILWWYGLTRAIARLSQRFDVRGIIWLNRTIGVVVMVVSVLGLYLTIRGKVLY